MKDVVALIPARSGSKGVPNKNIFPLCDIPLIAYSIVAALKSELIDRVIVSTDSEEYAHIAHHYGAEVPFLRPTDISGDKATDTQFFDHVIDWFKVNEGHVPTYFAHLRPTTPLRNPAVIDQAIRVFIGSNYTALRSCHQMSESSYKSFEIEDNKLKRLCSGSFDIEGANLGRQAYPETYDANGYIDVVRSELIQARGMVHGDRVQAYVTEISYEIDKPSDIDFLEFMVKRKPEYMAFLFDDK
jgi:CMP-N,N'-diacetyllegionaminic acid synthase